MKSLRKSVRYGLVQSWRIILYLIETRQCRFINILFFLAILQIAASIAYLIANETSPPRNEKHKLETTKTIIDVISDFNETSSQWPTVPSNLSVIVKLMNTSLGLRYVEVVSYGHRPRNEDKEKGKETPVCPLLPPNMKGRVKAFKDEHVSMKFLEKKYKNLGVGGYYKPNNCISRQKIAVIVPYRNRFKHLGIFLNHMHGFLQRQQLSYRVFVVEMEASIQFNKGVLMNVGFLQASKLDNYDCFIFHDVDLIPEDDRIIYRCTDVSPSHLSVSVSTLKYRLLYNELFGGVTAMTSEQFWATNGYSNKYFGWGGEDDDMFNRMRANSMTPTRYSEDMARFTMLKHTKNKHVNEARWSLLKVGLNRWKYDGINSLKYELLKEKKSRLYTYYLVKVDVNDDIFLPLINFTSTISPSRPVYKATSMSVKFKYLEDDITAFDTNFSHYKRLNNTEYDNNNKLNIHENKTRSTKIN